MTELLCQRDAYLRSFTATVIASDADGRVALDGSAFYPTGGGQPHDTGTLRWAGGKAVVTAVAKDGGEVWHRLVGDAPAPGTEVE
ncbi:MAG: alanine--tRNA ligase-related protein, partial [Acidimicrobiia bacterium]